MATYKVAIEALKPVRKIYTINDGDDWDGRVINNAYDAQDYAYDLAAEDVFFAGLDPQIDYYQEEK